MEIINEAIVAGLKESKRLVIPSLGAFIRKDGDDGKVVFVEFLKKDDGVLAGELARAYNLSVGEVADAIENFILSVRRRASSPAGYVIPGLGTMRTDAGGVIDLDYNPSVKAASGGIAATPATHPAEPAARTITTPVRESVSAPAQVAPASVTQRPSVATASNTAAEPARERFAEERIAEEPEKPEPAFKGMQYQKPEKKRPDDRKRKADLFLIIAIIAAVIAIGVMIFGAMNKDNPNTILQEQTEQTEQTQQPE